MAKRPLAQATREKGTGRAISRWASRAGIGCTAIVIGALIAAASIQNGREAAAAASPGVKIGSPAPDFTLHLFNGKTVTLSSLKGKPVVVNFWNSS